MKPMGHTTEASHPGDDFKKLKYIDWDDARTIPFDRDIRVWEYPWHTVEDEDDGTQTWSETRKWTLALYDEDRHPIALSSLTLIALLEDYTTPVLELTFAVKAEHYRRGLGCRMALAALKFATIEELLRPKLIVARVAEENGASLRICEALMETSPEMTAIYGTTRHPVVFGRLLDNCVEV